MTLNKQANKKEKVRQTKKNRGKGKTNGEKAVRERIEGERGMCETVNIERLRQTDGEGPDTTFSHSTE